MSKLAHRRGQIVALFRILRHFQNPWLIILLRLGLVELPYFLYRIQANGKKYQILARPTTTSMADLFVMREVLIDEVYRELLAFLPSRRLRWLDVGGNLGTFSIWLGKHREVGEAYAFEPLDDTLKLLRFNISQNSGPNVHVVPSALGGYARRVSMSLKESSPGGSSLYGESSNPESVEVLSFTEWTAKLEGEFDLLKLDCEGAEWEIVDSGNAAEQLGRFRVLVAEVHADPIKDRPVDNFVSALEAMGYRTIRWDHKVQGIYLGVRDD